MKSNTKQPVFMDTLQDLSVVFQELVHSGSLSLCCIQSLSIEEIVLPDNNQMMMNQLDEVLLNVVLSYILPDDDILPHDVVVLELQAQVPPTMIVEVETRRTTRSKQKRTWLKDFISLHILRIFHIP